VGQELDPPTLRAIPQLAEAINKFTLIDAKVEEPLGLNSRALLKAPFVYIAADRGFALAENEKRNLETYIRQGGFVFAEDVQVKLDRFHGDGRLVNRTLRMESGPAEASLRKTFKDVLGKDARFRILPNSHPIYHSFFDFSSGPPRARLIPLLNRPEEHDEQYDPSDPWPELEGIYLDGRLVAIYSDLAYGLVWEDEFQNEPHLKLGVNLVVYALTQEGSITQKQIETLMERDH